MGCEEEVWGKISERIELNKMIDPEIRDIYLQGASQSLDVVKAMAPAWQADQSNLQILQILDGSFLDLKGNSRMVGAHYVGDFAEAVEDVISGVISNNIKISKDLQLLIGEVVSLLPDIVKYEMSGEAPPDRVEDVRLLLKEVVLHGTTDFRYSPLESPEKQSQLRSTSVPIETEETFENLDLDEESREIFLESAIESTDVIEAALQSFLNGENGDTSNVMRSLHTLKGDSNTLGIKILGRLVHQIESLLMSASDEGDTLNKEIIELLRLSNDRVVTILGEIGANNREIFCDSYIEALSRAALGLSWNMPGQLPQQEQDNRITQRISSQDTSEIDLYDAEVRIDTDQQKADAPANAQIVSSKEVSNGSLENEVSLVQQQKIHVRMDTLDRIYNSVGQLKSYKTLLEHEGQNVQNELGELQLTINRLDTQLGDLAVETDYHSGSNLQDANYISEFGSAKIGKGKNSKVTQLQRALSETSRDLYENYSTLKASLANSDKLLLQQSRRTSQVEDELLSSRLVPFSTFEVSLHRTVRQAARTANKMVDLVIEGGDKELDRTLLQKLVSQIEHLLRNAVAHGIETVENRRAAGKSDNGRILLEVKNGRKDIIVSITDDGAGLDFNKINRLAMEKDLVVSGGKFDKRALSKMIFLPGFTTASKVNTLAGRGVGLDSVDNIVKQFGGSIEVRSEEKNGCEFTIRVPYKLATTDALVVQIAQQNYAIPFGVPITITHAETSVLQRCYSGELDGIEFGGKKYSIQHLGALFGLSDLKSSESSKWQPIVLLDIGSRHVGLQVDKLLGNQQILLKNVGPQMSALSWFNGGAILKNGDVALILDLERIVSNLQSSQIAIFNTETVEVPNRLVMVVDDSITIRTVTRNLLQRNDFDVVTAKDGVEALELLENHNPIILLLDVEMPRMDGYELTKNIRGSEQHKDTPIIMISSRVGTKNRRVAEKLGVNKYMGKPYDNTELIDSIQLLTTTSASN